MEHHDETGCQSAPEGPILCVNNCGFFGSSATMNMCSKCHKEMILKEEQAKLAQTSFKNIVNGVSSSSSSSITLPKDDSLVGVNKAIVEPQAVLSLPQTSNFDEGNVKSGPSRCTTCKKRVGLTGFKCRCGNLFCGSHRYSENHDCSFDYRSAGKEAIAKANPVVKAEKLDKI